MLADEPASDDIPEWQQIKEQAYRTFKAETAAARANYRSQIAEMIKKADRAEVYLLSGKVEKREVPEDELYSDPKPPTEWFPIRPYDGDSKIKIRKTLKDKQLRQLVGEIGKVLRQRNDLDGGAFCHSPNHGICFLAGDTILFETSFCYKCSNYYLEYPEDMGPPSLVGFSFTELQAYFGELFPDPGPADLSTQSKKAEAEQGGVEEPATRAESDSEDGHKPQPKSEGRSR
ncbi:MAG: hypothetical protein AAGI48_05295 [Verrucomicrobiota bacterium]